MIFCPEISIDLTAPGGNSLDLQMIYHPLGKGGRDLPKCFFEIS